MRPSREFSDDMYVVGFETARLAEVDPNLSSPRLKLYRAQCCKCSCIDWEENAGKNRFWDKIPQPSWWSLEAGDEPWIHQLPGFNTAASQIRLDREDFWPYQSYATEHQPGTRTHVPRGARVLQDDYSVSEGMNIQGWSLLTFFSNVANLVICNDAWRPLHVDRPAYLLNYPQHPDFDPKNIHDNWKRPETRMCANPFSWGEV
jgi:hypothetical protein